MNQTFSTLLAHKNLQTRCRQEMLRNMVLLKHCKPFPPELNSLLKEDAFEKPNQALFIHLTHYLVTTIDPECASKFEWPLFDKKSEHGYRTCLIQVISKHCGDGRITPILASHLVNASGFKVTRLVFQLSSLALEKCLLNRASKSTIEVVNKLCKFKVSKKDEMLSVVRLNCNRIEQKQLNWLKMQKAVKEAEDSFLSQISKLKVQNTACTTMLANITDKLVKENNELKQQIESLKNVRTPNDLLQSWDLYLDKEVNDLEQSWENESAPVLKVTEHCEEVSKAVMTRKAHRDKSSYTIQYNHETDEISINYLEKQVSSHQKNVLKSIVNQEKELVFPNLIRSYAIAVSFLFKDIKLNSNYSQFNRLLEEATKNFQELHTEMKSASSNLFSLDKQLLGLRGIENNSTLDSCQSNIPALPNLEFKQEECQTDNKRFTPLSGKRVRFRLTKSVSLHEGNMMQSTRKPQFKTKDDLMKNLTMSALPYYPTLDTSKIPEAVKSNETVNKSKHGFTQDQLNRLLSSQKSSSKKNTCHRDRLHTNLRRGNLFNETVETFSMCKSQSNPYLHEPQGSDFPKPSRIRTKQYIIDTDLDSIADISGITAIREESLHPRKYQNEAMGLPDISPILPISKEKYENDIEHLDSNKCNDLKTMNSMLSEDSIKTDHQVKKRKSIENIVQKYKNLKHKMHEQSKVIHENSLEPVVPDSDLNKENNFNELNVIIPSTNAHRLPDLLSPSFNTSVPQVKLSPEIDLYWDEIERSMTCKNEGRQSLGKLLGVDETCLDEIVCSDDE